MVDLKSSLLVFACDTLSTCCFFPVVGTSHAIFRSTAEQTDNCQETWRFGGASRNYWRPNVFGCSP